MSVEIQTWVILRLSKLRNKPKHFLKCYQIFFLLSGDISLIPG